MAELELQDSASRLVAAAVMQPSDVTGWRAELDHYYISMQQFQQFEPDEIFMALAGFSARASEIRSHLVRQQSRASAAFRTQEIDPFLAEVDRQFKLWSRVVTVRGQDIEMTGKVT